VCLMNLISAVFSPLVSLCFNTQISRPCKSEGIAKILYPFNQDCLWTYLVKKYCSEFLIFVKQITNFLSCGVFLFVWTLTSQICEGTYLFQYSITYHSFTSGWKM
jgi:hypothetical protein